MIDEAASTISQATKRGVSDVLEHRFSIAHPKTDWSPYEDANNFQQNLKKPFVWVNNNNNLRTNRLHPAKSRDGRKDRGDTSEFEFAQNNHATKTKAELAQFHHQSLFSPPTATIKKAIYNDQLKSFPGLEKALLKHLPISAATIKGHMYKQGKGLRLTRANQEEMLEAKQYMADMNPLHG